MKNPFKESITLNLGKYKVLPLSTAFIDISISFERKMIKINSNDWTDEEKCIVKLFWMLRDMLSYLEQACLCDESDKISLFYSGNEIYNNAQDIYAPCIRNVIKRIEEKQS